MPSRSWATSAMWRMRARRAISMSLKGTMFSWWILSLDAAPAFCVHCLASSLAALPERIDCGPKQQRLTARDRPAGLPCLQAGARFPAAGGPSHGAQRFAWPALTVRVDASVGGQQARIAPPISRRVRDRRNVHRSAAGTARKRPVQALSCLWPCWRPWVRFGSLATWWCLRGRQPVLPLRGHNASSSPAGHSVAWSYQMSNAGAPPFEFSHGCLLRT